MFFFSKYILQRKIPTTMIDDWLEGKKERPQCSRSVESFYKSQRRWIQSVLVIRNCKASRLLFTTTGSTLYTKPRKNVPKYRINRLRNGDWRSLEKFETKFHQLCWLLTFSAKSDARKLIEQPEIHQAMHQKKFIMHCTCIIPEEIISSDIIGIAICKKFCNMQEGGGGCHDKIPEGKSQIFSLHKNVIFMSPILFLILKSSICQFLKTILLLGEHEIDPSFSLSTSWKKLVTVIVETFHLFVKHQLKISGTRKTYIYSSQELQPPPLWQENIWTTPSIKSNFSSTEFLFM